MESGIADGFIIGLGATPYDAQGVTTFKVSSLPTVVSLWSHIRDY